MTKIRWDDASFRVRSDPSRRAQRRRLQGWWREIELGLPPGRDESGILRNNLLPAEATDRDRSLNFLSPEITAYAEARAPVVLAEAGALDADRLWRNLLSSMPLCFNIVGAFRAHPAAAARVLSQLTQLDVHEIEEIEAEWTPPGAHPLGDRTAFDAWIRYRTAAGRYAFLGVETKYTETFSPKVYDLPRYREVSAWSDSGFYPGAADILKGKSSNQLWRNSLLALAIRRESAFEEGRILVLGLKDDPHIADAMTVFRGAHADPQQLVRVSSLEELARVSRNEDSLSEWAARFERRYLDLTPVRGAE